MLFWELYQIAFHLQYVKTLPKSAQKTQKPPRSVMRDKTDKGIDFAGFLYYCS